MKGTQCHGLFKNLKNHFKIINSMISTVAVHYSIMARYCLALCQITDRMDNIPIMDRMDLSPILSVIKSPLTQC